MPSNERNRSMQSFCVRKLILCPSASLHWLLTHKTRSMVQSFTFAHAPDIVCRCTSLACAFVLGQTVSPRNPCVRALSFSSHPLLVVRTAVARETCVPLCACLLSRCIELSISVR